MRQRRLEEAWVSFRAKVIPLNAPETQVRSMRMAFYAGATFMFSTMTTNVSDGPEPQEADNIQMLDDLDAELREWQMSLMPAGKPS